MDLSPTEATVRRDGQESIIPAADVRVGEIIVIRPGQKIPLDGEVVAGRSAVNQAPITGESMPVGKDPGSEVFAGSINEHGSLDIRVTKLIADTTLARIIHAVEEAQASRAPSNRSWTASPASTPRPSSPSPCWSSSSRRCLDSAPGACGSTGPWRCS